MIKIKNTLHWIFYILTNVLIDLIVLFIGIFSTESRIIYIKKMHPDIYRKVCKK